ncbi:MAG TPA: SoxR reducing system RseC family protein [Pelomicrobium sp.]|nr:SoxR reducing system RseC family protein [Pelomicrobium sp.]
MLETLARVVEIRPGGAVVEVLGRAGCGQCAPGGSCGSGILTQIFPLRARRFLVEDPVGVRPGDEVVIAVDDGMLWRGSLTVYALGLAGVLLGALGGGWLLPWAADGAAAVGAVLGLAGALALIRRMSTRLPAVLPRVVRAGAAAAVSFQR